MSLFSVLAERGLDEVGFLDTIGQGDTHLLLEDSIRWIEDSAHTSPRTIWFPAPPDFPITAVFAPELKSRFVPMSPERAKAWSHLGPFPALATRVGEADLGDRRLSWLSTGAYAKYGTMQMVGEFDGWVLWAWKAIKPPRKALLVCHHSGVLPDIRRQLRVLGIRGEFFWLSDGKGPTGDAWPSGPLGPLDSSIPLLHGNIDTVVPEGLLGWIGKEYDMIITSHCMRYPLLFLGAGLPLVHVNSTRFGNEVTCRPEEFSDLCRRLRAVIETEALRVVHNNLADKWYAEGILEGLDAPVIPSICDQALRFRITAPRPKFLLWDTRGHALNGGGSALFQNILKALEGRCDVTSRLCKAAGRALDDDMLAEYTAVIHVPYNISTMSCFEQAAAGVPIWVPSPALLVGALKEYSELSWYSFGGGREEAVGADRVWEEEVIREFVARSDFRPGVLGNVLEFSSVEDLVARLDVVDYDAMTKRCLAETGRRKKGAIDGWAQVVGM